MTDDVARRFGGRGVPECGVDYLLSMREKFKEMAYTEEDFVFGIPVMFDETQLSTYGDRRAMVARTPLACVDGFRVLVYLVLRFLWGVRCCPRCPYCAEDPGDEEPCMDLNGSCASAEGGFLGRGDASHLSFEAQKSTGALHGHAEVSVQCIHQHTPLWEVMRTVREDSKEIAHKLGEYKMIVCREVYQDVDGFWHRQEELERRWPEYEDSVDLCSIPSFYKEQRSVLERDDEEAQDEPTPVQVEHAVLEGKKWLKQHKEWIQRVQEKKQNHIHPLDENGVRTVLKHCQRPDDPTKCRSGFPKCSEVSDVFCILCPGLLRKRDLPLQGRRCQLGTVSGVRNEANVNGTASGMLPLGMNSDVQLPYCLPITQETHSVSCAEECWKLDTEERIIETIQIAMDARTGYKTDYKCKPPMKGVHEVREMCKGHAKLGEDLEKEKLGTIGARHARRILFDIYQKSIVRSQVEVTNLRAYWDGTHVTFPESFQTTLPKFFAGKSFLRLVEEHTENRVFEQAEGRMFVVDRRNRARQKLTSRNDAVMYGYRGARPEIFFLSPYEICVHWELVQARYPTTLDAIGAPWMHCTLTEKGKAKLEAQIEGEPQHFLPGHDYKVIEDSEDFIPLADTPEVAQLRHAWVWQKRLRPATPVFQGCPLPRKGPKERERAAKITMTYLHPWTLVREHGDPDVPHLSDWSDPSVPWTQRL